MAAVGGAGAGAMPAASSAPAVEARDSRQAAVFGDSLKRLRRMDFLVIGMRGLGVEIAKNLLLVGVKSLTIYDPDHVVIGDLSSNYYLKPEHVGQPRAASVAGALAELNPSVEVSVLASRPGTHALSAEVLRRFHVVVATNVPRSEQLRIDAICRSSPAPPVPGDRAGEFEEPRDPAATIGFIAADVRGVAASAFVDYGDAHVVTDHNGEANKSFSVLNVIKGKTTKVDLAGGKVTDLAVLQEGQHVVFREVQGLEQMNFGVRDGADAAAKVGEEIKSAGVVHGPIFTIKKIKGGALELHQDTSSFAGEHRMGGVMEQYKMPRTVASKSLADSIVQATGLHNADESLIDWSIMVGRAEQLHVAFSALEAFRERHGGSLPEPRNAEHAAEVVVLAKEWAAANAAKGDAALNVPAVDEAVVRNVALLAAVELPALCAFYGGWVAHEVIKYTGKFTPLSGFLYLDAFKVLPDGHEALPAAEFAPSGSRYDGLVSIFGRTFHERVMNQRVFVVGAGALGCEMMKNYALMGVGCGPEGKLVVTDMDRIEVSNLSRQFLFRGKDVGAPKSVTAAAAALAMNPELKVTAMEVPVGVDTEGTFNDEFWEGMTVVTNALDNMKARIYVDERCIFYGKPLLESGTLGTKANSQVIKPRQTQAYSDSQDPPEESIPMCTLRNFPHAIEHCIEWARDLFTGAFTSKVDDARKFVADPAKFVAGLASEKGDVARRNKLEGVKSVFQASEGVSWASCVAAALRIFHEHFFLNIKQLTHVFHAEFKDEKTGEPFWTPPKRFPTAVEFSPANSQHVLFVAYGAKLLADNHGIKVPADYTSPESIAAITSTVALPPFTPRSIVIKASEADNVEDGAADDDAAAVTSLAAELTAASKTPALAALKDRLAPADFEKDDDSNGHIGFITAASNLRASNYAIQQTTFDAVKIMAGRIIPAIATTTCAITGLVCIEFYKLIHDRPVRMVETAPGSGKFDPEFDYRNAFVNLATNVFQLSAPAGAKGRKTVEYDPVEMGPVRAVPEGWTRWDRIVIKDHHALTPGQLDAWMKANYHGLSADMISMGSALIYSPLAFRSHLERKDKPIRDIVADLVTAGTAPAFTQSWVLLSVGCADADGATCVVPPVQLYIR